MLGCSHHSRRIARGRIWRTINVPTVEKEKQNSEENYKKAKEERDGHTKAILDSDSSKIVVVAGPGTGKTALFAKLLQKKGSDTLTLSFINALVDDLSLGLHGLSEVKTLHGFSAGFLANQAKAKIFPKLSEVIKQDAMILLGEEVNFDSIFHQGEGDEKHIGFYKDRKKYYGNYYGFADAIFGLVKYLETYKNKIPQYKQIVVDEFQDFNKTEVALIELLAQKSPLLIAGDDDQSLYIDLKDASPEHIRKKHGGESPDYKSFPLPFCSRSTRVIVDTVNDVVKSALGKGLLEHRVPKDYKYFPSDAKDKESDENPKLVYSQQYEDEMPTFIQKELAKIATKYREKFSVLIVVPPQLGKRVVPKLAKALKKKGFRNLTYQEAPPEREPTLIDGLKIILENNDDNLGWRIVARHLLSKEDFETLLKKLNGAERVASLLDSQIRKRIKEMIRGLKKIRDNKTIEEEFLHQFMKQLGHEPYRLAMDRIRDEMLGERVPEYASPRAIRGLPITITTVPRSKGLAADYVFVTHFDDQFYTQRGQGAVSDREIFSFLVALTRARKRAFLISSKDKEPVLLDWIDAARIERQLDSPHRMRAAKGK